MEKYSIAFFAPIEVSLAKGIMSRLESVIKAGATPEAQSKLTEGPLTKEGYVRVSDDGLSIYLKDENGEEYAFFSFDKDNEGKIKSITVTPGNPYHKSILDQAVLLEKFAVPIEEDRKKVLNQKDPTLDDFRLLYREIYQKIESEYDLAKKEGKKFSLMLLDKHINKVDNGFLQNLAAENKAELYGVAQIMALDAFMRITGEKNPPFLLEAAANNNYEQSYLNRFNFNNLHFDEVAGIGKLFGFDVRPNDKYMTENPLAETFIGLKTLNYEVIKLRDDGMREGFNSVQENFVGLIGAAHTIGMQGNEYEEVRSGQVSVRNPETQICSKTHRVLWLKAAEMDDVGKTYVDIYADNNSFILSTPKNWDLRKYNNPLGYFTLLNLAQGAILLESASKADKQEQVKMESLLSKVILEMPDGGTFTDSVTATHLVNIARVFSESGVQLNDPRYKAELEKVADSYVEACKHYNLYKDNKDKIDAKAKAIRGIK